MDRRAGSLLSVNVGLPQDVAWHGRMVHTAVWKRPVDGPRLVRRLNIDGDGQGDLAGHGGEHRAVFVYQIDSYRYWEQQLSRNDFSYGQFGENFTVDGLADDHVCIGDRYRVGEAVFEVTQPRVTCYRVGIRMADPQIPALLISHHRPGFYLRVLREGAVQAGDEIIQVAAGPEAMRVTEGDALFYLSGHPRPALPPRPSAPAPPARATAPGSSRRLEGLVPGNARTARCWRQRWPGRGEPAAGLAGVPRANRYRPYPGERVGGIGAPGRSRRSRGAACRSRTVPDPAATCYRRRCTAASQLLAVRTPGGEELSHQRQARAARCGQPVHPHPPASRRSARDRRPARHIPPALRDGADPADQRGRGGYPSSGHASRPGRCQVRPRHLVAAWCPQPGRGAVRHRVPLPHRRLAPWAPACLL